MNEKIAAHRSIDTHSAWHFSNGGLSLSAQCGGL